MGGAGAVKFRQLLGLWVKRRQLAHLGAAMVLRAVVFVSALVSF